MEKQTLFKCEALSTFDMFICVFKSWVLGYAMYCLIWLWKNDTNLSKKTLG